MSRTTKILLIIGAVCAIGCCGAFALFSYAGMRIARNVDLDPADAKLTAAEIADYTLPEGYTEQMGMDMLGMKMALFGAGDLKSNQGETMTIALIELPVQGGSADAASEAIKNSASQQMGGRINDAKTLEERKVTIRGEETTLTITEGTRSGGVAVRQATAVFTSKSDRPAMFMAMGPADAWDDEALDAFIASLK